MSTNRLLIFAGMTIGSYLGWWLGECMGFEMMGNFLISSVGTMVGIYVGWRIATDYLG